MFKIILKVFLLVAISFPAILLDSVDTDIGRPGQAMRVPKDNEFKVCADPNNLPFSNKNLDGFENKIAAVLAKDLKKESKFSILARSFRLYQEYVKGQEM